MQASVTHMPAQVLHFLKARIPGTLCSWPLFLDLIRVQIVDGDRFRQMQISLVFRGSYIPEKFGPGNTGYYLRLTVSWAVNFSQIICQAGGTYNVLTDVILFL